MRFAHVIERRDGLTAAILARDRVEGFVVDAVMIRGLSPCLAP